MTATSRLILIAATLVAGLAPGAPGATSASPAATSASPAQTPASHVTAAASRADRDTLRAAVVRSWPPHYRVTADGESEGFAVDVMRAVADRAGLSVVFVPFPSFPTAMEGLRAGEVDVIPDLGIIDPRSTFAAFTRPFEAFRISVFIRESDAAIEGHADLAGRRVGVVRGNAAIDVLRREHPDAELVFFDNVRDALFELLAAGVDAVAYPEEVFLALARSAGVTGRIRTLAGAVREVPRGMGVRASDTVLVARLDRAVGDLVGSPEYEEIYRRWFATSPGFWTARRVGWLAGGLVLLVLLGMVVWRYRSVARVARRLRESLDDREEARAAWHREEERFRTLVEAAYEGIITGDRENRITFANERICELVGVDEAELVGSSFFRFVVEEDRDRLREGIARRRRGEPGSYEVRIRRPDGEEIPVLITAAPIRDESGEFAGSVGTITEITERVEAEEVLARTARLLRKTLASVDGAVFVVDAEERAIVECNEAAEEIFGYSRDELIGGDTQKLHVDDEHFREFGERSGRALEASGTFRGEFTLRRADGSTFPSRHTVTLLEPEQGSGGRVVSVVRDVTAQKRAEAELRRSEERFRQIAERIDDIFWISSPDKRRMEYVSPAYAEIMGRPPGELYDDATLWIDHIHPEDREQVVAALPGQVEGDYEEEYRIVRPDGEIRWIWDRAFPVTNEEGRVYRVVGVAEDITERVRAERELWERERRYRAFVEHATDLISTLDTGGRMMYQSPPVKRLLGYEPEELRGRSVFELVHPDDRPRLEEAWSELMEEPGGVRRISSYRFRHADGTWRTWESTLTNLLRDPAVEAVLANSRDITERKELERRLRRSRKLEAVGRLAGGVAHDFNNLLTVIRANTEFLAEGQARSNPAREHTEEIRQAAIRGAELTRQLLAFSRDQVLEPRPTDLNEIVTSVERLLRRVIGEDVELVTELAGSLPPVEIDPGQFEQVIMNLAVNAREAMPTGGRLTVATVASEVDEAEAERLELESTGPHVRLQVRDTGTGMDEETRERVFEPFFTTKSQESGTGLGLATVYGVVQQSGGAIEVESEPGEGTTFTLHFPVTDASVAGPEEAEGGGEEVGEAGAEEAILVVEDDAGVLRVLRRALDRFGYRITVAGNVEEGKTAVDESDEPFDLIITDIVLPDGSGVELIEHVRDDHPDAAVLAMSGYSRHEVLEEDIVEKGIPFMSKPFTPATVAEKVKEALKRD